MTARAERAKPRSLAGATILQLVPALRDDPAGHAAVDIALTLLQSGARAIVAGEGGPLVGELRAFGGEWLPMTNDTLNPLRIRGNARTLAQSDRRRAHRHRARAERGRRLERARRHAPAAGVPGHLVSRPAAGAFLAGVDAQRLAGARRPRHRAVELRVARDDRALPDPARPHHRHPARGRHRHVQPGGDQRPSASPRCAASGACCRRCASCWSPGRIAPWNGQMSVIDAARLIVGERRAQRRLRLRRRGPRAPALCAQRCAGARACMASTRSAVSSAIAPTCRRRWPPPTSSSCRRCEPPLSGRAAAEAQAMGRPVVDHRGRHAAGERAGAAAHARRIAHRLAGAAGQCRRTRARDRARRSRSTPPPTRRWAPARANSPSSCSRRKALPKPSAGSIRRSCHATPDVRSRRKFRQGPYVALRRCVEGAELPSVRRSCRRRASARTRVPSQASRAQRAIRSRVLIVAPTLDAGAADAGAVELTRILAARRPPRHRRLARRTAGRRRQRGRRRIRRRSTSPATIRRDAAQRLRADAARARAQMRLSSTRSAAPAPGAPSSPRGCAAFRSSPAGTRAFATRTCSSISTTASWRAATASSR